MFLKYQVLSPKTRNKVDKRNNELSPRRFIENQAKKKPQNAVKDNMMASVSEGKEGKDIGDAVSKCNSSKVALYWICIDRR